MHEMWTVVVSDSVTCMSVSLSVILAAVLAHLPDGVTLMWPLLQYWSHLFLFLPTDFPSSPCVGILRNESSGGLRHQWLHSSQVQVLWQLSICSHGRLGTSGVSQSWRGVYYYHAVCTLQRSVISA